MIFHDEAPGVLRNRDPIAVFGADEVARVRSMALTSPLGRARICVHPADHDGLHEMLVALRRGGYIRPHRHRGKSESFHMVEGALDIVIFDDIGGIHRTIRLAAGGGPEAAYYYRLSDARYHTVLPRTEVAVFHEVTNGPFRSGDTEFAPWAPTPDDASALERFSRELEAKTR